MSDRPLVWLGSSLEELRAFPAEVRRICQADLDLAKRRYSELRVVRAQVKEV